MDQWSALWSVCKSCFCRLLLFVLRLPRTLLLPLLLLQPLTLLLPLLLLMKLLLLRLLQLECQGLALKPKLCLSSSIACCRRLCRTKRRPQLAGMQNRRGL
jgi:hypothetical protein